MRSPCLSKSNTLIFRGYSLTNGRQWFRRESSLKVNAVLSNMHLRLSSRYKINEYAYVCRNVDIRNKVERLCKCCDQIDSNISKHGKKLESLFNKPYIEKRIKQGL